MAQLGDSTVRVVSKSTIREHYESLCLQVDIARETALENIHKESDTLKLVFVHISLMKLFRQVTQS